MVSILIKKFIHNYEDVGDPTVRRTYGVICGAVGVLLNVLLCALKLVLGYISGAISITADGLNNLSDAFSSVVALAGFRMAGKRADKEHPYGHGRMEYVAGLFVAVLILVMATELIRTSIDRVLAPAQVDCSYLVIGLLSLSIFVKLYMALYNRKYGNKINSDVLRATFADSRNDMIATFVVLVTALVSRYTGLRADGWCGLAVGLFVLVSGVKTTMHTISTILGKKPDQAYIERIRALVMAHNEVLGVHDIVVHDYGPGRAMVSLHAEMPASEALLRAHATIDRIESQLEDELGCEAVIHIDPKRTEDKATADARRLVSSILYAMEPKISMHDFRLEGEESENMLSFDIVAPYTLKLSDAEILSRLESAVSNSLSATLNIRIDRGQCEDTKEGA